MTKRQSVTARLVLLLVYQLWMKRNRKQPPSSIAPGATLPFWIPWSAAIAAPSSAAAADHRWSASTILGLGSPDLFRKSPSWMSRMLDVLRPTHESAQPVRESKGARDMKYILMMNCPKTGYETFGAMPKEDIKANIAFQKSLDKALRESGELVSAEGLASPHQAKLVRAGKEGEPITDGVFPEAKEYLAGYWIVDVESTERAYEIAARASAAPGLGGAPMSIPIEVRQVMSGPPDEFL
jgi:hypothetical protein